MRPVLPSRALSWPQGQFGVVYRGRYQGRTVAIKKVSNALPEASAGGAPDWDPTVYFQREVELLQAVRHPNVLRFRVGWRPPGPGRSASACPPANQMAAVLASGATCRAWAT